MRRRHPRSTLFPYTTLFRSLDAYGRKEDLYIATASQMFDVPIEKIDKRDPLRDKGKVADLACGYGGSVGADRKSTRLNSSHVAISYAVFFLKKKKTQDRNDE